MSDSKAERYPSNSHSSKDVPSPVEPQRARLKRVTSGEAKLKKPMMARIMASFSGDDAQTVGQYILFDVIIPSIKDMVVDAGKEALERAFFGSGARPSSSRSPRSSSGSSFSYGSNNRTAYSRRYANTDFERDEPRSRRVSGRLGMEEIILPTRVDAEETLDAMRMAVQEFDSVSVADVYDLIGQSTDNDYMLREYGWTDLRGAEIRRLRTDEYLLDLPRTVRLS